MAKRQIKAGTYNVTFGKAGYSELKDLLRKRKYGKVFILVDENTSHHCLPRLHAHVPSLTSAELLTVRSGEQYKNMDVTGQVWERLSVLGADRHSLLLNLGGGVIGDMGGFAAATFMRGIDFVQIPTTLLSQVDASVGGKLGIDLGPLKNIVGVFSDPRLVIVDTAFLSTLPPDQILSGYSEILKHGLIADRKYWEECILADPLKHLPEETIFRSVKIKSTIVRKDPREKGLRKFLNFGHTIGHALESYSLEQDMNPLLHGEAVAAGMVCALHLSVKRTGMKKQVSETVARQLLSRYKLRNFNKFDETRVLELMRHDKKNKDGQFRFVLLKDIAKPVADVKCNAALVKEAFRFYRELAEV